MITVDCVLNRSSSVSIRHIDNPPAIRTCESLVYLTEELFAENSYGYEIVVFGGTVREVNNIVIDFNVRGEAVYPHHDKSRITN